MDPVTITLIISNVISFIMHGFHINMTRQNNSMINNQLNKMDSDEDDDSLTIDNIRQIIKEELHTSKNNDNRYENSHHKYQNNIQHHQTKINKKRKKK